MNGPSRLSAAWAVCYLLIACGTVVAAEPLRLPDTYPIPMAFRPLESGDPIEKLAPFPIVHAGLINEFKRRWPEKICSVFRGVDRAARGLRLAA